MEHGAAIAVWLICHLAGVIWTLKTHLHRFAWEPTAGDGATSTDLIHQWQLKRAVAEAHEHIKQISLT